MADRIEVSKLTEHVVLGPPSDVIAVSKLVMHVILYPGTDSGVEPSRQAHVYSQKIRRS